MRVGSRKYLLSQQTLATKPVVVGRKLSVRLPVTLHRLVMQAVDASSDSRNKWVSETLERFRKKYVLDLLALEPSDPDPDYLRSIANLFTKEHPGLLTLTDKEIRDLKIRLPEALAIERHNWSVDDGLYTMVKGTNVPNKGGTPLQILLNDEGVYAIQNMLTRLNTIKPADESDYGFKTILSHIALWDRVMEQRDMCEIPDLLTAKPKATRAKSKPASR